MYYYANELMLLLGGPTSAMIFLVAVVLALACATWPKTKLPPRTLLQLAAGIPLALAVASSIHGWSFINECCSYLQQQDALSDAQLQLFLDHSKRSIAWLILFGALYSCGLWALINWRMKGKILQTSSVHQATRA